jgi:diguanylate cyclase (GGDEF)-like protein
MLDMEELDRFAAATRLVDFAAGDSIVEIGEPGRSLYLLVDGMVQVLYPSRTSDFELARLGPGEFFGEMALLNDKPRSATVRAITAVHALVLGKEDFRAIVRETPQLGLQLLAALSIRIRNADEQISGLSEQSMRDPLTGLLNRRAFHERMSEEIDRTRRYHTNFALLVLDVDGFKGINDTLGHDSGDRVLAWIGRVLLEHTRAADAPFRIGGEEFAVLCPSTDVSVARTAAQRLVELVAEAHPPAGIGVHITMSAGYAACPQQAATFEDLFYLADQALLRAKENGRNRVEDPNVDLLKDTEEGREAVGSQ